ncbi:T-complex protein 1 subunit gamma [Eurytemora carolleeae]|uniref:T-complex protein 1 subunit gamma n=1 Tax=Eurytemora carolleeae TaxID=1294199 RepID=UPI000C77F642|nr:T-complex protein 1 subunit gamma [Eurytemora carolleeae]|eukprot:XP_023331561.1 T-complex protein 1 subunit gamma-like [Eurytemora affinis]
MMGPGPIMVLSQNTKRDSGKKVQMGNINAGKAIGDVVRTCLGPRAMLKMLMDPMGGIVMTNDGNAILREITVEHPAAKTMIEIARTQDEEVGDGTTSVIVLAAEVLGVSQQFLEEKMHPTVIIQAYRQALEDATNLLREKVATPIDMENKAEVRKVVQSCVGTKFIAKWSDLACDIAMEAVKTVSMDMSGKKEIDIKRYAKVEKIPGGSIEDSQVLRGVMFNKDVTHPKMKRRIEKPRILLLDCNLEYKKGESQTNIEIMKEDDFSKVLQQEEAYIKKMCDDILAFKPDLVITEKGVSDLAQHFFNKAGITAIRRLRKSDNLRVARACGATIVNRTDEISEDNIGTGAGLFEVRKIGDEYFTFIEECEDPKACTILLRGASKDILNEVERNLQDALNVARNLWMEPALVPGGGATEMEIAYLLTQMAKSLNGVIQWPYKAIASALEVIPRTIAQNCGANTIRSLTALRAKHALDAEKNVNWGINGETGALADMSELGIWEPLSVKLQVYKTAVETAILLLRIDDIVSGSKKRGEQGPAVDHGAGPDPSMMSMGE